MKGLRMSLFEDGEFVGTFFHAESTSIVGMLETIAWRVENAGKPALDYVLWAVDRPVFVKPSISLLEVGVRPDNALTLGVDADALVRDVRQNPGYGYVHLMHGRTEIAVIGVVTLAPIGQRPTLADLRLDPFNVQARAKAGAPLRAVGYL